MIDFSMYDQPEPRVTARKCPECGTVYHPAPMVCKKCNTRRDPSDVIYSKWEEVPIEGKCTLLAWTRVWALPEGYDVKYLLFGIAEFEDGLRASGRVLVDNPETGMELVATAGVVKKRGDTEIYGLMFDRPG
jgi:hypothetical protein